MIYHIDPAQPVGTYQYLVDDPEEQLDRGDRITVQDPTDGYETAAIVVGLDGASGHPIAWVEADDLNTDPTWDATMRRWANTRPLSNRLPGNGWEHGGRSEPLVNLGEDVLDLRNIDTRELP